MKNNSAFTLIELLVVIAISSVIMVTGFIYLGGYRTEQNLKLTSSELLAAVKNTQQLSRSQQNGQKWGIRFTNTTSSVGPTYSVFSGTSFAAGTVSQTYPLKRVSFSNPWASSTIDTIFNAITGYPSQPQVISLTTGRQDGFVNDITMNSLGQIASKFDTGLVGYWHLDEGTATTTYDASGYGNSGTLTNSPARQSGSNCKAGGCLSFSSSYVKVPDSSSLNPGSFSIVTWIKRTTVADWQRVAGKYYYNGANTGSWVLMFDNANHILCQINGGSSWNSKGSTATVNLNEWTLVGCTYNGSQIANYVNTAVATTSFSGTLASSNHPVAFAATTDGTSVQNYFTGLIDEVRIYNRALSATEIADQYNATR